MIYAFSVIKGYNSLRGSLFLHLSMAVAMIVFVRVPDISKERTKAARDAWWNNKEITIEDDETEVFPGADLWYAFNIVLHLLAAIIQYIDLYSSFRDIE